MSARQGGRHLGFRLGVVGVVSPSKKERTILRSAVSIVALTIVYFATGKLSLEWAFLSESASPVWVPTGIALAAMLFLGARVWPAVWVGAFLVNVTTTGTLTAIGIATGNTLEALIGSALVMRFANGWRAFETSRGVLSFILFAGILGPAVSATFGVTSLELGGVESWGRFLPVWVTWWLGDAVSALVITPLIVIWCAPPRERWNRKEIGEALLMLALVVGSGVLVFAGVLEPPFQRYPIAFMAVPALVWAAIRFGRVGSATATFVLSGVALWGTLEGYGPFVLGHRNDSLVILEAFIGTMGATILLLGTAIYERKLQQGALRSSEERERARVLEMEAVMSAAPALIWIAQDPECRVITGNTASYEFLRVDGAVNVSTSEPDGARMPFAVFQDGRELAPRELPVQRAARGETIRGCELEVRWANDGDARYILGNATTLRNDDGEPTGAVAVFVDITARKHAQRALRENQARLEGLILSAMDAIVAVDAERRVLLFNPAAERMFGCVAGDVLGRPFDRFLPSGVREPHGSPIEIFSRAGVANRRMGMLGASTAFRANGEEFPIEASVSEVEIDGQKLYTVILRDITERTRVEAELAASRHELEERVEKRTAELKAAHGQLVVEMDERARLEREMSGIVERERLQLGYELHEGLSQQLTGTGYLLSALQGRLQGISSPLAEETLHLQGLIAQTVDRAQSLARGFYPVELEGFGLLAALEAIARNTERSSGITCVIESDGSPSGDLRGPIAIQVFRIAQEAIQNVVTHSKARRVVIRLTTTENAIQLAIEDDGVGFPEDRDDRGAGIRIMRYRAQMAGGRLELRNSQGGGAVVTCSVPYPD
jgi:PAS domain S-box-containing protein